MTEVLVYWRDYRWNIDENRVHGWYSNARLLGGVTEGDRIWLVTSGKNVGHDAKQAGFLVAIWTVREVVENSGDDPAYPADQYRFVAWADSDEAITFADPVPVDHILRPHGRDKTVSIGRFLQGPRRLNDNTVRLLRAAAGPELALRWLTGSKT